MKVTMRKVALYTLVLTLLASGCTLTPQAKVAWLDRNVIQGDCEEGPCVVAIATLQNTGKGDLRYGAYVAYAYDLSGEEISRGSSTAYANVGPGEQLMLRVALPGITVEQVSFIRVVLVGAVTDLYNPDNHLPWEIRIPVRIPR